MSTGRYQSTKPFTASICVKMNGRRGTAGVADEEKLEKGLHRAPERIVNAQSAGMGKDQSHEAIHLLSQPPSALVLHRHGRSTRFFLQTEEGHQASIHGEQTQNGQTRRWQTWADASGSGNESAEPSDADWKSVVSSTAKSLLRGVRDSADAFPPLKSVAGGLCFILENCEVWPPPIGYPQSSQVP